MASVQQTIDTALKMLGVVGAGRSARPSDAADCLTALEGMYGAWIAAGAFGRVCDVIPTGNSYAARGNERIYRQTPTLDVTLPDVVSDGWINDYGRCRNGYYGTLITVSQDGDEVTVTVTPSQPLSYATTPRDGSPVIISDEAGGQTAAWLYDGTLKTWERIDGLQYDDDAPRSRADPTGLAAMLAIEVSDLFNNPVGEATQRQAARYSTAMTQRFGMRREVNYQPQAYM